jgi:hypothetical protein
MDANLDRPPAATRRRRRLVVALVAEVRRANPCRVCGSSDPATHEFHHHVGAKCFDLGRAQKRSVAKVLAELGKTVPLCAAHHRDLHAGRLDGSGLVPLDPAYLAAVAAGLRKEWGRDDSRSSPAPVSANPPSGERDDGQYSPK